MGKRIRADFRWLLVSLVAVALLATGFQRFNAGPDLRLAGASLVWETRLVDAPAWPAPYVHYRFALSVSPNGSSQYEATETAGAEATEKAGADSLTINGRLNRRDTVALFEEMVKHGGRDAHVAHPLELEGLTSTMTFNYGGQKSIVSYWQTTDAFAAKRSPEPAFVRWVETESLIGRTQDKLRATRRPYAQAASSGARQL